MNIIDEAHKGVKKLISAGIPTSDIYKYDLTEEEIKEFQKL